MQCKHVGLVLAQWQMSIVLHMLALRTGFHFVTSHRIAAAASLTMLDHHEWVCMCILFAHLRDSPLDLIAYSLGLSFLCRT